jgi:hypothetical protein
MKQKKSGAKTSPAIALVMAPLCPNQSSGQASFIVLLLLLSWQKRLSFLFFLYLFHMLADFFANSRVHTHVLGRLACLPSWSQLVRQVCLLAEPVPAQLAGLPARRASTSSAGRFACLPSRYQLSWQVCLLAELVPGQLEGLPVCLAGTNSAGRSACLPSWYQISWQVFLLAGLVAAERAGLLAHGAGISSVGTSTYSPRCYQVRGQV